MGFFSWRTQDTDVSIANQHSTRDTFTVVMLDDKGNKWYEQNYDGYGVFGGKDYYELLAEMNGWVSVSDEYDTEGMRMRGIELAFKTGKAGETYNIGGRNERNNLYIVDTVCTILNELNHRTAGQILPNTKSNKRYSDSKRW
jgi:hypothetical protein